MATQVLIVKRMPVIHHEFKSLLDEDREEDLGRMYKLMHRTGTVSGGQGILLFLFRGQFHGLVRSLSSAAPRSLLREQFRVDEIHGGAL